jgi:hypothetical protein
MALTECPRKNAKLSHRCSFLIFFATFRVFRGNRLPFRNASADPFRSQQSSGRKRPALRQVVA